MPSTTSNNSDSACSQALSSSDIEAQILHGVYDRADGDQFMHGRFATRKSLLPDIQQLFMNKFQTHSEIPPYTANEILPNFPRISSEEESGFSTPTRLSNQGKKLVYEVVV